MANARRSHGKSVLFGILVVAWYFLANTALWSQVPSRIQQKIDDRVVKRIPGSTHPLAKPINDIGRVDGSMPMERMMLLLQPSPDQEATLTRLINHQADKAAPEYHQWLSPDEFGARFGPAQQDLDRVTGWLQLQGFTVNSVAHGKQWIEFSGTAAQVETAFHTEIHQYHIKGENHIANATDLSVPEALASVVRGVLTVHDFQKRPMHTDGFKVHRDATSGRLQPDFTFSNSSGTFHFISPSDFSRIYNTLPLLNSGIDGKGVSIAIVARSNVELSDVQTFRKIFGLPAKDPNFIVNGRDPGPTGTGDEVEADLDVQWAGAAAPQATVNFVVTGSTFSADGSDLSLAYIVDHRVASIVSSSFGLCEAFLGPQGNAFFRLTYEQAAAQGMTVFVSSGDNGAAGCDNPFDFRSIPAVFGLNVNGNASTAFNIAVGGTQFAENGHDSDFWLATNRPGFSSAVGYIPEAVWNESCDPTVDPDQCGNGLFSIAAGSGGQSSCVDSQIVDNVIECISGYPKPSWQAGKTVPNDGVRDLPDLSLAAAAHEGYLVCVEGACQTSVSDGKPHLDSAFVLGGTSASTPAMAGIMALVEQKNGTFQGLANANFYQLAATESLANCNSTLAINPLERPDCIFLDVTHGSNSVPGQPGFQAKTGYDLSTGLGSVNALKLVSSWKSAAKLATRTLLSSPGGTVQHGQLFPLNVSVRPVAVNGVPSGDFDLFAPSTSVFGGTLAQGGFSGGVTGLPGGQYALKAHYGGDPTFAASDSNSIAVSITPEPSSITMTGFEINLIGSIVPLTSPVLYGQAVGFQFDVSGKSGIGAPTGSVTVFDNKIPIGKFQLDQGGHAFAQINDISPTGFLVGHHTISVTYSGDKSFQPSGPVRVGLGVIKRSPRGFIFPVPAAATAGAPVRFLLSVLGDGQQIPTGDIQMFDNGVKVGSPLTLQPNGPQGPGISQAVFSTSFSAGDHDVGFNYSGDKNFNSIALNNFNAGHVTVSVSAAAGAKTLIQVQQVPLTVSLAGTAKYSVSVRPVVAGGPMPTGTVSLVGPNGIVFADPVALVTGNATVPLTFDAAGKFQIAASYSGDVHYSAFSSSIVNTNVNRGTPAVTLKSAAAIVQKGAQTSFSVSVVGKPSVPAISIPFGFVQFYDSVDGGSFHTLGSPQFLTVGNGGNPTFSLPVVLPSGNHTIKAQYLGSNDWAPMFSNTVNVLVQP